MANPLITPYSKPTRKVGFVLKSHGYKGHLRIEIEDEEDEDLVQKGKFLFVEINTKWVPFYIEEVNADKTVVKLEDVDNEKQAAELISMPLVHFDAGRTAENDFPDIIGYTVIDPEKNFEAEVLGIIDMPGHSLIQTRWQYKEVLIPYHEDIVTDIDETTQTITVSLPDGLLEL